MGWVVVGGASTSLLCLSLYLNPRLAQVSEKAGRLFATRTRAGGQWIGSQRPFFFFFESGKRIRLPLRNMDLKKMDTKHTGR